MFEINEYYIWYYYYEQYIKRMTTTHTKDYPEHVRDNDSQGVYIVYTQRQCFAKSEDLFGFVFKLYNDNEVECSGYGTESLFCI